MRNIESLRFTTFVQNKGTTKERSYLRASFTLDGKGVRQQVPVSHGDTEEHAREWVERVYLPGLAELPEVITLASYVERFEAANKHLHSLDNIMGPVRSYIAKGLLADLPVETIGTEELVRWLAGFSTKTKGTVKNYVNAIKVYILGSGKVRGIVRLEKEAGRAKPNVDRFRMAFLDDDFKMARAEAGTHSVRDLPDKSNKPEAATFEAEAMQTLLGSIELDGWAQALTWTAFGTGMRAGELFGLTFSRLHLGELPHVKVQQQLSQDDEIQPPKAGSNRWVPLPDAVAKILRSWTNEGWEKMTGRKPEPGDFVFADNTGRAHYPSHIASSLRSWMRTAGLSDQYTSGLTSKSWNMDFHATRRTYRTLLISAGVADFSVERLMGHEARGVKASYQAPLASFNEIRPLLPEVNKLPLIAVVCERKVA